MAAPKQRNTWGLTGKLESVYGTYDAPADSEGILALEPPIVTETPLHDGSRVGSSPGGNRVRRVAQSGFESAFPLVTEAHGGGAAYSASVLPSVHLALLILGFEPTLVVSTSYTYAPEVGPTGLSSASFRSFVRGEVNTIRGAYAEELTIEAEGPVVPTWTFNVRGIRQAAPTDLALPAITGYPNNSTNLPPKSESVGLSINGVTTLVLKSWSIAITRELTPRDNDNAASGGAHSGFATGRRDVQVSMLVENIDKGTFDPVALRDAQTAFALSWAVGSVQFKKYSFSMPQAQIVTAEPAEDGPRDMWQLTIEPQASSFVAQDDLTILFN